ncbi:hypothetical protein PP707_07495 [Acetobacter pasteurianus]|nr:hypothetical protein [Acetobacter pasteurianus]
MFGYWPDVLIMSLVENKLKRGEYLIIKRLFSIPPSVLHTRAEATAVVVVVVVAAAAAKPI